jgi:hypothetical protein
MTEFKDVLQMKRQDPSIDLHKFSRNKMLEFFDTIKKKKSKSSALTKKEVVTMDPQNKIEKLIKELRSEFMESPATVSVEAGGFELPKIPGLLYVPASWIPTAQNINDLPDAVRKYIHDLETICDPAGIVRENAILKDTIKALEMKDPDFLDDPDLHEFETGIHYEIRIRWRRKIREDLAKTLREIFNQTQSLDLFVCVPSKFAGRAILVTAQWQKGQKLGELILPKGAYPNELLLVSTGSCFEESKNIKIEESDRILVYNGSSKLFETHSFELERKSELVIYRTRR